MLAGTNELLKEALEKAVDASGAEKEVKIFEASECAERPTGTVIELPDIPFIEQTSRMALRALNTKSSLEGSNPNTKKTSESDNCKDEGLTDEEKTKIKEETGWSDKIIENIKNMKQYEILRNADLKEVEINGRKCLIKEDIYLDHKDAFDKTNRERIAEGKPPIDSKTRKPIELHHLGQKADSPLVELNIEEHRTGEVEHGKKNQSLWHDNSSETEVHGEGDEWDKEREAHWKTRYEQMTGGTQK